MAPPNGGLLRASSCSQPEHAASQQSEPSRERRAVNLRNRSDLARECRQRGGQQHTQYRRVQTKDLADCEVHIRLQG